MLVGPGQHSSTKQSNNEHCSFCCAPTTALILCFLSAQASASAEHGQWDGNRLKLKGLRKITPSQPPGVSPRLTAHIPPAIAAAAAAASHTGSSDLVKLKLQQAFLEQYSSEGHKASAMQRCLLTQSEDPHCAVAGMFSTPNEPFNHWGPSPAAHTCSSYLLPHMTALSDWRLSQQG